MNARYRTEGVNHHGADGTSRVPGGLAVRVASPLKPQQARGPVSPAPELEEIDAPATNPEQLLALAWATCLNATAQVILGPGRRSAVRVEVELREARPDPGFEFHVDAYLSVEGADRSEAEAVRASAHARCPVSKLLRGAPTVRVHTEPYRAQV